MEKYYPTVLNFILNSNDAVSTHDISITGIESDLLDAIINDLIKQELLTVFVSGYLAITADGKHYLTKAKYNIPASQPTSTNTSQPITVLSGNDFAIIHANRANQLRDAGLLDNPTFLKNPDLTNTDKQNKIPAKQKNAIATRIKKISLIEWAAIATIMGFIVALWSFLK